MTFQITEDAVLRRSRKGVRSFPLKEVQLKLRADVLHLQDQSGASICVNVFWLRDFRGFFTELKDRLDAKHLSSHYDALDMSQWPSLAGRWDSIRHSLECVKKFYLPMGLLMLNLAGTLIIGVAIGSRGWAQAWSAMAMFPVITGGFWPMTLCDITRALTRQQAQPGEADHGVRIALDRDDARKIAARYFIWRSVGYVVVSVLFAAAIYFRDTGFIGR